MRVSSARGISSANITGDLLVHGDAEGIAHTDIDGDLVANGSVELEGSTVVHGDVVVPNGTDPDLSGAVVEGPATANRGEIYVDDAGADATRELEVTSDGSVVTPGDRAGTLWLYLMPSADVDFNNRAHVEGVVYGPGDTPRARADITLNNHAAVFGAVVGDVQQIPNHAVVHYDEAPVHQQALGLPEGTLPITCAHVTRYSTSVDG